MAKSKIILAGVLWGFVGLCVNGLVFFGWSLNQIVATRFILSSIILAIFIFFYNKKLFKPKNIFCIIGLGIANFATTLCYYKSIIYSGGALACITLYLSPILVIVTISITTKTKPNITIVLGAILALMGISLCVFPIGKTVSLIGFLWGIGSAFSNATVTLLGAKAVKNSNCITANFYAFIISAILAILILPFSVKFAFKPFAISLILAGFCTVLPFSLYVSGLKNCQQQTASVLCCCEPVVSFLIHNLVFNKIPNLTEIIGLCGIIISVWLVGIKKTIDKKEGEKIDKQILQTSSYRT